MKIAEVLIPKTPASDRVKGVLGKLKDDEVLTTADLRERAGVSQTVIDRHGKKLSRLKYRNAFYYGTPKALAELRRQIGGAQ